MVKAVVAFAGNRDAYQLPLALHEAGLLQGLVTDIYWPLDRKWFGRLVEPWRADTGRLPHALESRYCANLPSQQVKISPLAFIGFGLSLLYSNQKLGNFRNDTLSRKSASLVRSSDAALFSYSYYAFESFQAQASPHRFLFQVHPHPQTTRQILQEELELTPAGAASLKIEPDLALAKPDFNKLAAEPHLANGWVVASHFTAQTLIENGIASDKIHIVPYGVDSGRFPPRTAGPPTNQPLTIIFAGSMIQRKGLSYALEAARLLKTKHIRLVLAGRGFCDTQLINQYKELPLEIKVGLPQKEFVQQIQQSDIMLFPSLVEGFAHVLLETMACGLPIIATPHTCAPDLIADGQQGFIVPIRNAQAIAEKLEWCLQNRSKVSEMGFAAAKQASQFTWERFRAGIRAAYLQMLNATE